MRASFESAPTPGSQARRIVVADEDRRAVEFIIETLRREGHAVFHAYDVLAATQLVDALAYCDLLISNTKVANADGVELIVKLRKRTRSFRSSISPTTDAPRPR